jgi:FkbM family methyltransferase
VIDLGAYSGLSSILFNEACGSPGRVVAVEADESNITAIKKNFSIYKKLSGRDLQLIFGAAWSHCDGVSFSTEGNMGSSALEVLKNNRGKLKDVPSYTLSRITEIASLSRIDFIKCDIEGAEAVVFSDDNFFKQHKPRIIIETHVINGEDTTGKCIRDLERNGYKCERLEQHGVSLPLLACSP